MLTHITIGFDNVDDARAFYDYVLEPLGLTRLMDHGTTSAYGPEGGQPQFMVLKPLNGEAATSGNGSTIGLVAPNRSAVNEFHKRALERGGKDEGAPGLRPWAPTAYGAYIRDVGGHKICAFSMTAE